MIDRLSKIGVITCNEQVKLAVEFLENQWRLSGHYKRKAKSKLPAPMTLEDNNAFSIIEKRINLIDEVRKKIGECKEWSKPEKRIIGKFYLLALDLYRVALRNLLKRVDDVDNEEISIKIDAYNVQRNKLTEEARNFFRQELPNELEKFESAQKSFVNVNKRVTGETQKLEAKALPDFKDSNQVNKKRKLDSDETQAPAKRTKLSKSTFVREIFSHANNRFFQNKGYHFVACENEDAKEADYQQKAKECQLGISFVPIKGFHKMLLLLGNDKNGAYYSPEFSRKAFEELQELNPEASQSSTMVKLN